MANSASDRTVNKIALCGAIFAGVAYVGYSVVKQAFGKTFFRGEKKKEGKIDPRQQINASPCWGLRLALCVFGLKSKACTFAQS